MGQLFDFGGVQQLVVAEVVGQLRKLLERVDLLGRNALFGALAEEFQVAFHQG